MRKITFISLLFLATTWFSKAQTPCSQIQTSNNVQNGLFIEAGGQRIANDFIIATGTLDFSVESITANLLAQGGISSINILFFNDNAGLPGTQIGQTIQNLTPTSQNIIGNAFGYDVHEVVLNLPNPVIFSRTGPAPSTYWVQLVAVPNVPGTQVAWEVTTLNVIGNATLFDNGAGSWAPSSDQTTGDPYDGVFEIEGICASCAQPQNLVLNTITSSTADISWTASPDETNGYSWKLMADGDNPVTGTPVQSGTTPTGTTSVALSGLSANTEYDFYVANDCGTNGKSFLAGPLDFKTNLPCNISGAVITFPYAAGFELSSSNLGCWTQVKEDGDGAWIFAMGSSSGSITNAYAGTHNARFVSTVGTNSPVTKLVSPVFDLTGLANPELSFYYAQEDYVGDQNELKVYYRQSSADAWVELAHYTNNVASWTEERIVLPNATATYQIAFEGINNYGHANVIDEVRVGEMLSVESYVFDNLNFYPNPVKDELFLNSKQMIDKVAIYNLLGEKVLSVETHRFNAKLNVSDLPSAMYLMEVFIGENSKAYKLLKK